jgi:hypothetical protein
MCFFATRRYDRLSARHLDNIGCSIGADLVLQQQWRRRRQLEAVNDDLDPVLTLFNPLFNSLCDALQQRVWYSVYTVQ